MIVWYSICGWVRVRKCTEAMNLIKQLGDHCGAGIRFEVSNEPPEELVISIEGGCLFVKGYALGMEKLLESLAPFALEAAVFSGQYHGQLWEVVVAPSEQAGQIALSQSRLEEIDGLVDDLTAEDRARLVAKLQSPGV